MGEEPGVGGRPHLERFSLPGQVDGRSGRCPALYCCIGRWRGDRDQDVVWGTGSPCPHVALRLLRVGHRAGQSGSVGVSPEDTRHELGPQAGQALTPLTSGCPQKVTNMGALAPSVSRDPYPATQRASAGAAQIWVNQWAC